MNYRKVFRSNSGIALIVLASVSLCGCESQTVVDSAPGSETTATPTVTPAATPTPVPASLNSELYFQLISAWDQAPSNPSYFAPSTVDGSPPVFPQSTSCMVAYGESPGPGNAGALNHSCTFDIPEAQLYYSNLTLVMGSADLANCSYMIFYPYFYEINGSTTPPVPGGAATPAPIPVPWLTSDTVTEASCYGYSAGLTLAFAQGIPAVETPPIYTTAGCYNGPATTIPNFPSGFSILTETENIQQTTFSIPSGFSQGQASNRWVANDSTNIAAAGSSYTGEYLLSSMHGYTLQCLNQFGVLTYQMAITIIADHTTGPPATVYQSWR